jgi:hypothetical protein
MIVHHPALPGHPIRAALCSDYSQSTANLLVQLVTRFALHPVRAFSVVDKVERWLQKLLYSS